MSSKIFCSCVICKKEVTTRGLTSHIYSSHTEEGRQKRSECGKLSTSANKINAQKKHSKVKDLYESAPKFCKECNTKIEYLNRNNDFCNQSCAAHFNNRTRPDEVRIKQRNTITSKYATKLKKPVKTYITRPTTICSHPDCNKKIDYRANHCSEHRISNKIFDVSLAKQDKTRRLILIRQQGNICSVCSNKGWNSIPIPLELDHIDGDSDNNVAENLRLICPNCHAQTKNYKGANKGNSKRQLMRRTRYKNGLTF